MGKFPLSVIIITKNEEQRIADSIASVAWADDIIVLDDESQDRTKDLAKNLGARVLERKMDVEGTHRNFGIQQGRHAWVLSLDADERVSPELAEEIQKTISGSPACNGYTIPIQSYLGDRWIRHGGWYPAAKLRLFLKEKFRYEDAEVHPRAFMPDPCGHLTKDIIHYSFRDFADFFRKLNNQTTLEAHKWLQDGRKMSTAIGLRKSLDRFFRSYVRKKGYKEGFLGFMMSFLGGLYQWMTYAKYWEMKNKVPGTSKDVCRKP